MICGPVDIGPVRGLLSGLQSMEKAALMISAFAWSHIGYPLLASAANLAMRRSALMRIGKDPWNRRLVSGDDVFLMHKVSKLNGKRAVLFLANRDILVRTMPESGLKAFFNQRIRWASKIPSMRNMSSHLSGMVAAGANMFFCISLIGSGFMLIRPESMLLIFLLKAGKSSPVAIINGCLHLC